MSTRDAIFQNLPDTHTDLGYRSSTSGVVDATTGDSALRVLTPSGPLYCRRALSCLIVPEPGDTVLIHTTGPHGAYVLAVLERAATAPVRVTVPGNLTLSSEHGSLTLRADTVETIAGTIFEASRQTFRQIDGIDHVRASHIDHEAAHLARVHAGNVILSADRLMKIDGDQIHLG